MDSQTPRRLLVRLPNWVGDVVMATPALRALRGAWPSCRLTVMLRASLVPLLADSVLVDDVLPIGPRDERLPLGAPRIARRLAREGFDMAILLTNSFTSALPPFLARIPRRVGYSGEFRRALLTHWREPLRDGGERRPIPMPVYYQHVLDLVDVPSLGDAFELPRTPEDEAHARRVLEEIGWDGRTPLVALNPGASFGSSKLWRSERLAAVGDELWKRLGLQPLVLCGPGEESLAREVAAAMRAPVLDTSRRVVDLRRLRGLLRLATLLVTMDTGPRHIATAMGTPSVVLMGPTNPAWTACHLDLCRVVRHPVPCGPCHQPVCPTDHACMEALSVEEVVGAAEDLLRSV